MNEEKEQAPKENTYNQLMESMSKEDFFNVCIDCHDLIENEEIDAVHKILTDIANYVYNKKYIEYLREIYSVDE